MPKGVNYKKLFDSFSRMNVMVIGDVMVDSYLWGKVERISPEAPIPIVALRKREHRMGGAANVAMNIRAMGAKPILCSVIGTDDKGDIFLELMKKEKMNSSGIVRSQRRITTTKFRIFGNTYQMLRVDEEEDDDLVQADYLTLSRVIDRILETGNVHCIIFQDYNKGVLTPKLIQEVVKKARKRNIPVAVDPKRKNFESFSHVNLFKPNLKELKEGLQIELDAEDHDSINEAAQALREKIKCDYVMTTLSEHGMLISMKDKQDHKNLFIPAHVRPISDVSGAGDTVISVASLCMAAERSPYEIAFISNLAGGIVCEEVGVVPINKDKLLKEVISLL
ncbi:MAG: bifunctional heptose 7-phosphate kinase/heptose 1-phosphate adenyltransferase [Bacteroidales bacterium]